MDGMTMMAGMGAQMGNAWYQEHQNQQRHNREKELMAIQLQNQRQLNSEQASAQMNMWNKTSYDAQVRKMKEAGLNPALMYAKGGQGGTTGSIQGGSASKGSAGHAPFMDMSVLKYGKEMELLEAQAKKAEADARQSDANANAISGYKKEESQSITNLNMSKRDYVELQKTEQSIINANKEDEILSRNQYYWGQVEKNALEVDMTTEMRESIVKKAYNDNINVIRQNAKISQEIQNLKSDKKLTDRRFNEIEAKLYIEAQRLIQTDKQIKIDAIKTLINKELTEKGIDAQNLRTWVNATAQTIGNVMKLLPTSSTTQIIKGIAKPK
jgi:hypothetical protein